MRLKIDAEVFVATDDTGLPTIRDEGLLEVSIPVVVNGKTVSGRLIMRPRSGAYSGTVHSGISGSTTYHVEGIEI